MDAFIVRVWVPADGTRWTVGQEGEWTFPRTTPFSKPVRADACRCGSTRASPSTTWSMRLSLHRALGRPTGSHPEAGGGDRPGVRERGTDRRTGGRHTSTFSTGALRESLGTGARRLGPRGEVPHGADQPGRRPFVPGEWRLDSSHYGSDCKFDARTCRTTSSLAGLARRSRGTRR